MKGCIFQTELVAWPRTPRRVSTRSHTGSSDQLSRCPCYFMLLFIAFWNMSTFRNYAVITESNKKCLASRGPICEKLYINHVQDIFLRYICASRVCSWKSALIENPTSPDASGRSSRPRSIWQKSLEILGTEQTYLVKQDRNIEHRNIQGPAEDTWTSKIQLKHLLRSYYVLIVCPMI